MYELYLEKEKTLKAAWLISLLGPILTVYAFYISGSVILLATLIRRTIELISLIFAWYIFKKVRLEQKASFQKWERLSCLLVSLVLIVSVIVVLFTAFQRFADPQVLDNLTLGLILSLLGCFINRWFWVRKRNYARQKSTPIIEAQWRLYRSKTFMDILIVLTLLGSIFFGDHPLGIYLDPVGSVVLAIFLLYSSHGVFIKAMHRD